MDPTGRRRALVSTAVVLLAAASLVGTTAAATSPKARTAAGQRAHSPNELRSPSTAPPPTTTTTSAPVPTPTPPAATPAAPPPTPVPATTTPSTDPAPAGYGCPAALAYLATHAAPGFTFECPGSADGHEAMTCVDNSLCPGEHLIAIADPCPAAYMNEAYNSNSWSDALGEFTRPLDPYGAC